MQSGSHADILGEWFPAGVHHYRAFVGPAVNYDLAAAMQFNLLTFLGLREHHSLLDIGCGSLRAGRLFIPYLLPEKYCGVEPERWLIEEGIKNNVGGDLLRIKRPVFSHDAGFNLGAFGRRFDYVLAQSVFSHASAGQVQTCVAEVRRVMAPEGLFAATFVRGETSYTGTEWVYPDCVSYTEDHFRALVAGQGLTCRAVSWPHPHGQTWVVIGRSHSLAKVPPLLYDPAFFSGMDDIYRRLRDRPWEELLNSAAEGLAALVAPAEKLILVDEEQLRGQLPGACHATPFLERDGEYWGPPPDNHTAIRELERLRRLGADLIAFAPPAFWWLEHYAGFAEHLRSSYRCVLDNDHLVVFDLRNALPNCSQQRPGDEP
jgi:SAM-dependent methyltransferase